MASNRQDMSTRDTIMRHLLCGWKTFIAFVTIYAIWEPILESGFDSRGVIAVNVIFDCFYLVDILVDFYYTPDVKYIILWFVCHGCSILPVLISFIPHHFTGIHRYGVLLRTLRVLSLWYMMTRLEKNKKLNYMATHLLKPVFVFLTSIHCGACIFYALAAAFSNPVDNSWVRQGLSIRCYTKALYWSVVTATTTGYGDFGSTTEEEMAFNIIYMIYSPLFIAYMYGWICSLFPEAEDDSQFILTVRAIDKFAQQNKLDDTIRDAMVDHLRLKYKEESTMLLPHQIPNGFPKVIRSKISKSLISSSLDKLCMFKGVSDDFLNNMALEMEMAYFYSGEEIISKDDNFSSLYVHVSGNAVLQYSSREVKITQRCVIGESSVCCDKTEPFTARAESVCQCLKVHRGTFLGIMHRRKDDRAIILSNVLESLCLLDLEEMESLRDTLTDLVVAGIVSYDSARPSLHVAADIGNYWVFSTLLNYGADPDQADGHGKTPYSYATSRIEQRTTADYVNYEKILLALYRRWQPAPLHGGG